MKKLKISLFNDPTLIGKLQVDDQIFSVSGQFQRDLYADKIFQLIKILKTTDVLKPEFGQMILFFQEKTDRKHHVATLAIHGGDVGLDWKLRQSKENSIRVHNEDLHKIVKLFETQNEVELVVEEIQKTIWNYNVFTKPQSISTKHPARNVILSYHKNQDYHYPNQDNEDLISYLLYSWAYGQDYNHYNLEPYEVVDGFTGFGGGQSGGGGASGTYELPDPRNHIPEDGPNSEPLPVKVIYDEFGQTVSPTHEQNENADVFSESHEDSNDAIILDEVPLNLPLELDSEPFKNEPFPTEPVVEEAKSFEEKNGATESLLEVFENRFDLESGSKNESFSDDNPTSFESKNESTESVSESNKNESPSYDSPSYDSGVSGTSY